jgi:hypothetical protein
MKTRITLLAMLALGAGCTHNAHTKGHDDGTELPFAQTPPAVQATLTREAGGFAIRTVEKETEHGRTIYEAEVQSGDKTWEIKVAEDGKLISKKVESDDDDDDDEHGEHMDHDKDDND